MTVPALRPSEYSAALIQQLRARAAWVRGAEALEIGFGSGVVLAALGALGAATLHGVDIEPAAGAEAAALLDQLGLAARLVQGDLWQPLAGRRFELVAANLPHFPMAPVPLGARLPSWSSGGPDGRRVLDRFLAGLPQHLAPRGRAVITHNGFVSFARTGALLAPMGLAARIAATILVAIPPEKLAHMTPAVLAEETGRSILRLGPHAFGEVYLVEIGRPDALG